MQAYTIDVDRIGEEEWSHLLSHFADANVYQAWAYGSVRWGERNLSHLILKRGHSVVAMAQLRIIRPTFMRFGIAYLRWGPLCHLQGRELDPGVMHVMGDALYNEYVNRRGLGLEVLPNAFSGSRRAELFDSAFGRFSRQIAPAAPYRTLVLDLTPSLEAIRCRLDKKWRNQLNASEKNDLQVVEADPLEGYSIFRGLYIDMWQRKRFDPVVDIREFGSIQGRLCENQKMIVFLCEYQGKPVAGLVCSAMGDSAIYLLGATNETGMKVKASYLLQWTLIERLKQNGTRYYDLGGIDPTANPGVYHFKSGLCGEDISHIGLLFACNSDLSRLFAAGTRAAWQSARTFQRKFVGMRQLTRKA